MMDIKQIQKILPHRYPFLLIDRIVEFEPGVRVVAIKNVTFNEPQFTGHWPGDPVMPGVLIVEAMAQSAGVLLLAEADTKGKNALFAGIDNLKFRRRVVPGDQLRFEGRIEKRKRDIGKAHVVATVDGELVAEGDLMFALVPRDEPAADDTQ
ncbi:MAG TPA: 3-hydroxyacyl-[acyl-carrier-protein] dehydratase FabZ [Armatimonadetes bacterium]|jgi:3-hydroxyacyl-[acyl-carrier-protein] dehydratase|nr:3-hydroxyacyl-[acyl-carrier-protein] dehydratase FabZ [Armatimonadota bacterium]